MAIAAALQHIDENFVGVVSVITIFVVFPIALGVARYLWKRAGGPAPQASVDSGTAMRLAQMQQSLDTMAVEIERISEGQRFVTKLLSEREKAAASLPADRSR
jgi:hypothetical protein